MLAGLVMDLASLMDQALELAVVVSVVDHACLNYGKRDRLSFAVTPEAVVVRVAEQRCCSS